MEAAGIQAASGQPVLERLEPSTDPTLPLAPGEGDSKVWVVAGGATVVLEVTAVYSDGSSEDVTDSPQTSITALAPQLVTVNGASLTFAAVSEPAAPALLIQHGGKSVLVGFSVNP